MTLVAQLVSQVNATYSTALDISSVTYPVAEKVTLNYANGTGAGQATTIFTDTRTLAASATENLDLAGTLVDAFGAVVTFTKVKAIRIRAAAANTNSVIIGGAATNAFVGPFGASTHTIAVGPGGVFTIGDVSAAGWTVVAATGDLLKIANGGAGTSVDYTVEIIGA